MIVLDEKSKTPLYAQLCEQIKEDIVRGGIKSGAMLPSSRKLAADLRISRNTVELAYEQLYAEGFLISKPRRGYFAELPSFELLSRGHWAELNEKEPDGQAENAAIYDFQNERLHPDEFPFEKWKALTNKCFRDYKTGFLQYGCPLGEPGLRSEIQRHIFKYRQVTCQAKQIVIGSGTQSCLELLCPTLKPRGLRIAMEEPGHDRTRATLRNNGFEVRPVGLDEKGIGVERLRRMDVAAAYVTPSRQYPTGIIMPRDRRLALVEWARQNDAFLIEDDDNCCFQYDEKPLPSLQSLCSDRVIYIGSFADLTFPAIGIAYMVLPHSLLDEFCERHCSDTTLAPFLTQKTLELFMREEYWEGHVRKTVRQQRKKRDRLVSALKGEFGDRVQIQGSQAGLHVLVQAKWRTTEAELVGRAARAGVKVQPTSVFWSGSPSGGHATVLLHYSGMTPAQIPDAVRLLREAWLG
jgi:GntR family transcriptional regulator/MocR family aminotransferase